MKERPCHLTSCPVSVALEVFGGKWKLQIIWILHENSLRFGELKRQIPEVSEKILIQALKDLTKDGVIIRIQYPEVPPRVEYHLTEMGRSLLPILKELSNWSIEHLMKSNQSP
jgi:DNA-binding HxlR family transcriptional regulator